MESRINGFGKVWRIAALVLGLAFIGACGSSGGGTSGGAYDTDPYGSYDSTEYSNDDYYDGCEWSEGCGATPGAWDGDEDNSLYGDDEIDSLYD